MTTQKTSSRLGRIYFVTCAALSTTGSEAFLTATRLAPPPRPHHNLALEGSRPHSPIQTRTRLYSSKKEQGGFLDNVVKTILPKKWFHSEEEQEAELARQEVKDNVKGGIKELLKDAPLPAKMMGSLLSPILSRVASDLQEGMVDQQRTIEDILDDARACLLGDEVVLGALGEPLQVGAPFSQSSSTSIINGQKSVNVAIGFPVEGSRARAQAQAQYQNGSITQLTLQVDGRLINVSLSRRASPSGRVGRNHRTMMTDDIIEAEIVAEDKK